MKAHVLHCFTTYDAIYTLNVLSVVAIAHVSSGSNRKVSDLIDSKKILTCIDFIRHVFLRFFNEAFYLPVFGFVHDNTVFGRLFDSSHLQQVNVLRDYQADMLGLNR